MFQSKRMLQLGIPLLLLLGFVVLLGSRMLKGDSERNLLDDKTVIRHTATRESFLVIVTGKGSLQSMNNVTLSSEVNRQVKIIKILAEGTKVKKGDVVCELDTSDVLERLTKQELDLRRAEGNYADSQEKLSLQEDLNETDISKAKLALKLAKLDLKKYEDGEYVQQQKQLKGSILLKQEDLTRDNESLEFTKRMVKRGYSKQADLETAQLAVAKTKLGLASEEEKLRVLEKYTYERKMAELNAKAIETGRELIRANRKSKIALQKAKAAFESRKLALGLEKKQLEHWKDQLKKCTIIAPQNGEVIHANERARRWGDDQALIRVGSNVYESTPIIRLPDLNKMQVNAKIHESRFFLLKLNQKVEIQVDSYPDKTFEGTLKKIASVAVDGEWPNRDIKQYHIEISFLNPRMKEAALRPGSSANFKIIVSNRPNILQVPLQGVVGIGKSYYAWVMIGSSAEKRLIKIGETNEVNIEILDGIKEGEEVILNPRSQFSKEIATLQQKEEEQEKTKAASTKAKEKAKPSTEKEPSKKISKPALNPKKKVPNIK